MPPEKPVKPTKPSFTDEQIRAKAHQLWEKNKEQSPEENWNAAVKALEREKFWRPLMTAWRWTGIGEKKGWDIFIQLLSTVSIPVLLFFATQYFTKQNNEQQQKIAEEKQKDELLKTYINDMKASLLDKDHPLKDWNKNSESKSIARTITLTTLTQLNSEQDQQKAKEGKYNQRKGLIMQFLYESDLIRSTSMNRSSSIDPIIILDNADFTFAYLYSAYLYSADLNLVNLESANLQNANLNSANLTFADLYGVHLYGGANLQNANLYSADLQNADLQNADLKRANLNRAYLYSAKNLTNEQIKSACFWEKAIYTERDQTNGWIAKDPEANQKKIDEIKQDKASDPRKPPDCSNWKKNPFLKWLPFSYFLIV